MATRTVQVMVDQWGHTPGFPRGTTIQINDDDPERMMYSADGGDPQPFVGDVDWAIRTGALTEIDKDGDPLERADLPFPAGRLPIGNEAAIDRGDPPTPGEVAVASGSAEDADPTMVPATNAEDAAKAADAAEAELTPAQKAARTRAANAERERAES